METIYTGPLGQKLFLYSDNNFLYLRSCIGTDISRPILLCDDYSNSLSGSIFQDSVHFSYQNIHGDLIVRNILDPHILFRLSAKESPDYASPVLLILQNKLLLLYFIQNPLDETYLLRALYPLEETEITWNPIRFSKLPSLQFIHEKDFLIMLCQNENSSVFYKITNHSEPVIVPLLTSLDIKKQINHALQEKNNIIENIRQQYEELRNTAIQYRDEASKWYNKYYSQK